jgi:hypothetical protein
MNKPRALILDVSPFMPALRQQIHDVTVHFSPHDLHGTRSSAIQTEVEYHLDNICTMLGRQDMALTDLMEYQSSLRHGEAMLHMAFHHRKVVPTISDTVGKMSLHLFESVERLGAYIDGKLPYIYHGVLGPDAVVLSRVMD